MALPERRRAAPTSRAQRDAYEALFRRVIQDGIDAGEFPGADARMGAPLVLSAGNWLYQWFRPDGPLRRKPSPRRLPIW